MLKKSNFLHFYVLKEVRAINFMINNIGLYNLNGTNGVHFSAKSAKNSAPVSASPLQWALSGFSVQKNNVPALNKVNTRLTNQNDIKMYNEILNAFITSEKEKTSPQDNVLRQKKLDALLKNGTLLNNNSNDKSSVLQNLYKTIKSERAANMDGVKIAGQIIDTLYNPAVITQKFGDIPKEAQVFILDKDKKTLDSSAINVEGSGTCVAASVEFHMANKQPAEFSRWAESLTSPDISVEKYINLSALSKNTMDALWLLKEFEVKPDNFNFYRPKLKLKPDENAIVRAQIQDNYWDKGERSILDVLFQSTLMQLGSQQTYDTLTDTRGGKFNSNPQGLIEFEKTFIESIVDNSERTSVVYQNVDDKQNLIGWNCDLGIIQKNITDAIDSGEDVIVGYVLTAQECNETSYEPNKIVNGHEITIVDYKKDAFGNMTFVCNDTDDDKPQFVEYPASYLLPKIHHASYPVQIVEQYPNIAAA